MKVEVMDEKDKNVGADESAIADAMSLASVITVCTRLQGHAVDRLQLHDAISTILKTSTTTFEENWQDRLGEVISNAGFEGVDILDAPDEARLPAIAWLKECGWLVVRARSPAGDWIIDVGGNLKQKPSAQPFTVARLVPSKDEDAQGERGAVYSLFKNAFMRHKKIFTEAIVAGALINLLALATSMFSMQVYDRVIPTQGYATLAVLILGVAISVIFELALKLTRSYLVEHAAADMDKRLSRDIFGRLLEIRLDQLPGTVGSLSSQLRGYETIRNFLSTTTFYLAVDVPFGVVFIFLIALIGGFFVGLVPLIFLIFSIAVGIVLRKKIDYHASKANASSNLKTGLLVEAIEGAETIKASGGGWGILSRWLDVVQESITHEMINRNISEKSGYFAALLQQFSYVMLVGVGAYFAAEGNMTTGALIACSILSGRVLGPIAQLPSILTQKAHAKAALVGLEKLFELEVDNHGIERPLLPSDIRGHYTLERVHFSYGNSGQAISIPLLEIKPGEKIGVIGHIGSGKSTLLRLLTGMYQPSSGQMKLDGLLIDHINRLTLVEKIGYLQQEHRLFLGTLRQNLLVGIPDPGDDVIQKIAARTGLLSVISNHPKGLELIIAEGGKGLSVGQRQLVAFTRLLLGNPKIWLLDEPTASMDEQAESRNIELLRQSLQSDHTLLVVTHKAQLLTLVDRLIVVANHRIVMDGPRDEVIERLRASVQKVSDGINGDQSQGNAA